MSKKGHPEFQYETFFNPPRVISFLALFQGKRLAASSFIFLIFSSVANIIVFFFFLFMSNKGHTFEHLNWPGFWYESHTETKGEGLAAFFFF